VVFAHDTEVALNAAAALINSGHDDEKLLDVEALDAFVTEWGWTGDRAHDTGELADVRSLRPRLEQLWHADEDDAVATINEMLRETQALPQLVKHDQWDYHLHATPADVALNVRMMVEAAMAFIDVIRMKELDRLRVCAADDCDDVVVDLSKNRSRRFCDSGCGNRANVAAYRARRAGRAAR
jgi:predicted RNA-binding Zn ribbon-like protein